MIKQNRIHLFLQLAAAFLLVVGVHARTWTSADGTKTFEGKLKSYDATSGKVSVTKPNGKRMSFTQDKLSTDDIAWLKKNGGKKPSSDQRIKIDDIKAYCLDFNWGRRRSFAKPGSWCNADRR